MYGRSTRDGRGPERNAIERPPNKKAPLSGAFQCAREDSNFHGPFSPQGPQPCASTNSATGAGGGQYSPAVVSVHEKRYIREHMFALEVSRPHRRRSSGWT